MCHTAHCFGLGYLTLVSVALNGQEKKISMPYIITSMALISILDALNEDIYKN